MSSGIYKITNLKNGKFYIGSSKNIEERWDYHKQHLHGKYHINPKLQHAWNFYGEDTFLFEIIEETNPKQEILFDREQHYLDKLKPYDRVLGYNICPAAAGGDCYTNNPNKDKIIEKLSQMNTGYKNPMFGKHHTENAIKLQKEKSVGRYTLEWFVERYGTDGEKKFEERRQMLINRKMNYITTPIPHMSFKGHKHKEGMGDKQKSTAKYFDEHWNDFVELVKSGKYSQRQLSEMLNISRVTLRVKMKQIA
jgi:group I intron endonuclease